MKGGSSQRLFIEGLHRRSSRKVFTCVQKVFTEGLHRCSRCSRGSSSRDVRDVPECSEGKRAPSSRQARAELALRVAPAGGLGQGCHNSTGLRAPRYDDKPQRFAAKWGMMVKCFANMGGCWCVVVLLWCCGVVLVLCCVQVVRIFASSTRVFIVGSLCGSVRLSATASCILELETVAPAQTSVPQ